MQLRITPILLFIACLFSSTSLQANGSNITTIIEELNSTNDVNVLIAARNITINLERSRLLLNALQNSVVIGDTQLTQIESLKTSFNESRSSLDYLNRYSVRFGNIVSSLGIDIEAELQCLAVNVTSLLSRIRDLTVTFGTRETLKIENDLL